MREEMISSWTEVIAVEEVCRCDANYYEEKSGKSGESGDDDQKGIMQCLTCPAESTSSIGSKQISDCKCSKDGSFFDKSKICKTCDLDQYVAEPQGTQEPGSDEHDIAAASLYPTCEKCPNGASCVDSTSVQALFGWSRCPPKGNVQNVQNIAVVKYEYAECLFPAACEGMANPMYFGRYTNGTHDPAKMNLETQCATGYVNSSLLCSGCSPGYSSTETKRCNKCPEAVSSS
jgi:hypothetical protein